MTPDNFKKIVVPIDFSDLSFSAVDYALQLVGRPRQVDVLHVVRLLPDYEMAAVWSETADTVSKERAQNRMHERLMDAKYDGIKTHVRLGDPGTEIAKFAEQVGADLIVLPSHSRSVVAHIWIGSVAERVVRLAHCPVLVLKSRHEPK